MFIIHVAFHLCHTQYYSHLKNRENWYNHELKCDMNYNIQDDDNDLKFHKYHQTN